MTNDFLITLFSTQQPRRHRVIFGLLKHQATVSTEYWGLRYRLLNISGLLPKLDRAEFEKRIAQLLADGLLIEVSDGQLCLSAEGQQAKRAFLTAHYVPQKLDILLQYDIPVFMQVFLLATQVLSEKAYDNKTYYPLQIEHRLMQQVKHWYTTLDKTTITSAWVAELTNYLQTLPVRDANALVATWIGHDIAGLNFDQLDLPSTWHAEDFYFWQLDMYAGLVVAMQTLPEFAKLVQLVGKRSLLPAGVQFTYDHILAGETETTLLQQRRIKIGTIREHLLTAAIWLPVTAFPYEQFLTPAIQQYFAQRLDGAIDDWTFSMVRQSADPYEFFLFRLYEIWQTKNEDV